MASLMAEPALGMLLHLPLPSVAQLLQVHTRLGCCAPFVQR